MSVAYSLVPKEMLQGLMTPRRDLDEYLVGKSQDDLKTITKSRKLTANEKALRYMATMRNMIRAERRMKKRPMNVSVVGVEEKVQNALDRNPNQNMRKAMTETPTSAAMATAHHPWASVSTSRGRNESFASAVTSQSSDDAFDSDEEVDTSEDTIRFDDRPQVVQQLEPRPIVGPVASTPRAMRKPARKGSNRAHPYAQYEKKQALVEKVLELINANPQKFGVDGNKLVNNAGNILKTSNLKNSVNNIVSNAVGFELEGQIPAGTKLLKARLDADEQYKRIIATQRGKGKKVKFAAAAAIESPPVLPTERTPAQKWTDDEAGSIFGTKPATLQVGEGRKRDQDFRAERWRKKKR